ncbi:MAG: peptidase [Lentisphaerae bacterium]|nr:peptidase [Lentisphaerota bacterium]
MRNKLKQIRDDMGIPKQREPQGMAGRRALMEHAEKAGISLEDMREMRELGRARRDPKIQENAQIAETVTFEIRVLPNAKPGRRELRLMSDGRLSAPLAFHIGGYPEHAEVEPNNKGTGESVELRLPAVLNGQIMPGDIDRFSFKAARGDQLVISSAARELIPHLADAVPGWFQATLALYDANDRELAYADDYRFNPDPALYYEIPADGNYTIEIKDALYRGRQDFVYRITVGEIPFITAIFPLGGKSGTRTAVEIQGKNLPIKKGSVGNQSVIATVKGTPIAYPVPFGHDTLREAFETEPNNTTDKAMPIGSALVVNGRIGVPGDRDVYRFQGQSGKQIVVETKARRLNSPLDSILKITDAQGRQLALNDDHEDKGLGLLTHHADSRIVFVPPGKGIYYLHVGDTQNRGGAEFAYRLRIGRPDPGFELRVVPSNLNGHPGSSVPLTVYALRRDGFDGEIELKLKNKMEGVRLDGARIPAGQDHVQLTLTLPTEPLTRPKALDLEGHATIGGKTAICPAVPAEDMMQAFIYHHLVPAKELLLSTIEGGRPRRPFTVNSKEALTLRPGATTTVSFSSRIRFRKALSRLKVELGNAPAGVEIESVSIRHGRLMVSLKTDSKAAKRGEEGNLVFDLFIERTPPQREGQPPSGAPRTIRIHAGVLPAVPFKVAG